MYTVNLNHDVRKDVLVCTGKIVIRHRKFSFSFPKGVYSLKISEEVILPEGVENPFVLRRGGSMFSLQYGDNIGTSHKIDVTGLNEINFNVFFKPGDIVDCKWKENRKIVLEGNRACDVDLEPGQTYSFKVRYVVTLLDAGNECVKTETGEVEVSFERLSDVRPAFVFVPSSAYREGIIYDATLDTEVEIGKLRVSNSSSLLAAPAIDTAFEVMGRIDDEDIPGLLTLGEPEETVNYWDRAGFMMPDSHHAVPNPHYRDGRNAYRLLKIDTNKVTPGILQNESYVTFPVKWNMAKVTNPEDDKIMNVVVRYKHKNSYEGRYSDPSEDLSNIIEFKRNPEVISLELSFDDTNGRTVVDRTLMDESKEIVNDVRFPKNDPVSMDQEFNLQLTLENTASAGSDRSAVIIKDFRFGKPDMGDIRIELTDKRRDMMKSLFSVEGALASADEPIILGQRQAVSMRLTYRPRFVGRILKQEQQVYAGMIRFPYSFKYAIDAEGRYEAGGRLDYVEVKGEVEFKVSKIAAREWLCVDFGSSAVVGAYGAGLRDDCGTLVNNLIPLKDRKEQCLLNCFPDVDSPVDQLRRKDVSETSDFLVTSATSLDGEKIEGARDIRYSPEEFGKHSICFSPSSGMQNITHMLPCLKSMMGHKHLPVNLIPDDLRAKGLREVEVNHVFEIVYKQLFGCFLQNEATESQKLVMSVPNTYSPVHLGILRNIARECMPNLRPDYTNFISESDAVACYYLSNQLTFCRNSKVDHNSLKNSNVLVYDMGAGTLDLTYFTQREVDNRMRISIDGKMGVSKAGNYLDYVLATIIVDMIVTSLNSDNYAQLGLNDKLEAENFKKELPHLLVLNLTTDMYADAFPLKNYVKTHIKPLLNKPDNTLPSGLRLKGRQVDSLLSTFTVNDILSHKEFRNFLRETTEDVFRHFASLFGTPGSSGLPRMNVDVVIFSGRMTGIKALRNEVKSALRILMPSEQDVDKCRYADLASKRFVDINEEVEDVTDLKTVVVEGAMAYCTQFQRGEGQYQFKNTNIYATYGLILERQDGGVAWLPLVDFKTSPSRKGIMRNADGITINQYDTNVAKAAARRDNIAGLLDLEGRIDGSMLSALYLVQSYSSDPVRDWESEQKEMMTILGKYDSQPMPLSYRLVVNEMNELQFSLAGFAREFLPHDDIKNKALRMSNWPISFANN